VTAIRSRSRSAGAGPPHPATHGAAVSSLVFGPFHATEAIYRAGVEVPRHRHERAGFTLTVSGSYVETFRRSEEVAGTGSVLVKPAEVLHGNRYDSAGCRCFLIGIDPEYLASHRGLAQAIRIVSLHRRGAVPEIMVRMYREFRVGETACSLLLEGLALELAAMVLRSADRPERVPPRWVGVVREHLHGSVGARTPKFSELAATVGVHPVHLSRAFRAAYGCTPGEYLRRLRIEQAQRLLAESRMPLAQVARAVGYYDQSHFTAVFRRVTGSTPARYRARHGPAGSCEVQAFPSQA
jgi:AraC family transcriptional regulator